MKVEEKISKYIEKLLRNNPEFTGNLQFNFYKGGVTNVNQNKSEKLEEALLQ